MTSDDRRESYRISDVSKATCYLVDGSDEFQGKLRNLSMAGFFLETHVRPGVSKQFEVKIVLEGKHSRLVVDQLSGTVTRSDADGVAVEFSKKFEWLALVPIFYQETRTA